MYEIGKAEQRERQQFGAAVTRQMCFVMTTLKTVMMMMMMMIMVCDDH